MLFNLDNLIFMMFEFVVRSNVLMFLSIALIYFIFPPFLLLNILIYYNYLYYFTIIFINKYRRLKIFKNINIISYFYFFLYVLRIYDKYIYFC